MSTYSIWQPTLQPTGLRGRWGAAWAESLGAAKDTLVTLAQDAVTVRSVRLGPSDALERAGSDRSIPRQAGEAVDAYRARLAAAWESWSWVGTDYGISLAVGLLGWGYPAVISYAELPWDTASDRWSRLRILFTGFALWGALPWSSWSWGSRVVEGIEPVDPVTARVALRRTLRQWINARDRVFAVTVARGSAIWGRFVWGSGSWSTATTTEWGPPLFGEPDTIWGTVAFGVFC